MAQGIDPRAQGKEVVLQHSKAPGGQALCIGLVVYGGGLPGGSVGAAAAAEGAASAAATAVGTSVVWRRA